MFPFMYHSHVWTAHILSIGLGLRLQESLGMPNRWATLDYLYSRLNWAGCMAWRPCMTYARRWNVVANITDIVQLAGVNGT